jgi:hypothetical protein
LKVSITAETISAMVVTRSPVAITWWSTYLIPEKRSWSCSSNSYRARNVRKAIASINRLAANEMPRRCTVSPIPKMRIAARTRTIDTIISHAETHANAGSVKRKKPNGFPNIGSVTPATAG